MQLPDRDSLKHLANQLVEAGRHARQCRSDLRAAAAGLSWRSGAAREFQGVLSGLLGQFGRLGQRLDELADRLAEHAARAARRAELLAPATRMVRQLSGGREPS
jgi:hypothetical protein